MKPILSVLQCAWQNISLNDSHLKKENKYEASKTSTYYLSR